jgi:hypothetical protein
MSVSEGAAKADPKLGMKLLLEIKKQFVSPLFFTALFSS